MDRIRVVQVLLSVAGISIGQLFLKLAAINLNNPKAIGIWIAGYCLNIYFIVGICMLGVSTLLWIWVLRALPLNIAYPFMALAFVIVPMLSYLLLGETMGWKGLAGSLLIIAGVVLINA
jgi:drug/metabolite transporter (DMT)-like permease